MNDVIVKVLLRHGGYNYLSDSAAWDGLIAPVIIHISGWVAIYATKRGCACKKSVKFLQYVRKELVSIFLMKRYRVAYTTKHHCIGSHVLQHYSHIQWQLCATLILVARTTLALPTLEWNAASHMVRVHFSMMVLVAQLAHHVSMHELITSIFCRLYIYLHPYSY